MKSPTTEAYAATLKAEIFPGILRAPGYKGSYLLQRSCGQEVEFITAILWDSLNALREFTGADYERAIVPVERRQWLSRYEERSAHYEILMQPTFGNGLSGSA
jgi:heme-degrading monooxygenase HmoA